MSKKALFIFPMIMLGLIPANVTGASLFSDDFESGDFTSGGWSTQNGDASVSNKAEYEGTYGAQLKKTTWIEKAISTVGYTDIHVKYYRKTNNFDTGEYLYIEWYDGSGWNELEATQDTSWGNQQDKTCGSGANDNSSFKVRFRTNASAKNESAYVDYVEITGTSGGPTPGVTIVESNGSTDVDEDGPTSDTYTVVLDTQPTDTVTINVDPDIETEVNDNGAGNSIDLTFLTTNWDSPQTVTVKAIDDGDAEGAHTSTITHTATSNDNDYNGISIDDVVANVTDNDNPGVTIVESGGSTDVDEEGPTSDTYTVVLDSQPTDTVTITVDPDIETEVNNNGAGNSINLTFLTTNWDSPQIVTVKAIDDIDEEGAHTSTITHTSTSNDNDYDGISIDDVVANVTDNDGGGQTDDTADSDIPVSGTVSGSYTDTQSSEDSYESIEEKESGGKPANRYTYLEHKWTIDVTGGDTVTFYVEAYHTANTENDDFIFAYSTDDDTYTDMLTVTKTSDDDSYQSYELPSDTTGIVYIRVKDTDQTQGNRAKDTIYIDHMYIRSEVGPPGQASDPNPADEANNVSISIDLSWSAGAATQSHDVYLGTDFNDVNDANTASSGIFKGNQDANSYDPGLLSLETTYYWRIDEKNDQGTTKGDVWSFSTANDTDGDNIGDNWESQYGLDPYDANDADQDLDSDNYNNLSEYLHETDPNDPNNVPSVNITIAVPVNVSTIQRAINASIGGDTVIVSEGTYYENINFGGRAIALTSTDPNDPNVVASTIIDANNTSIDVVTFNSGEDPNSVLEGITFTGGRYGIYCSSSSPTVNKCTIRNNNSSGLRLDSGAATFYRCTIRNNNSHGLHGYGGITLKNCFITNNSGRGVYANILSFSTFKVISCTVFGNDSYGISGYVDEVTNCIVWDNDNDLVLAFGVLATYSCIKDIDLGEGNIHADPMFIDADGGDYHLWYSSQCIDAGDPNSDCSNEPNNGGGRINMGAYGNTDEATVVIDEDNDGISDHWEVDNYLDPNDPTDAEQDLDGDKLRNIDEYNIAWDSNDFDLIDGLVSNTRTDLKYPTISMAINLAFIFDTLVVDPNTFYESISFKGKPIHIRSTDSNEPNVVASTIIDANNPALDVVTCVLGEDANSILEGMTITGGRYGIYFKNSSSPTITGCTIRDNSNHGVYGYGDTTLKNCFITHNSGRGVHTYTYSALKVINCTVVGNSSYGISGYVGEVKNCIVWDNNDDIALALGVSPTYCCIEDGDPGLGNLSFDPCFVDADSNDFHLDANSPCIDTGAPWSDYSNEPSPNGNRINMGAYGNTAEAMITTDTDSDGISDSWEKQYWPGDDPNQHDPDDNPDSDDFSNKAEYLFGYDPTQDTNEPIQVPYVDLLSTQIDPTKGQMVTIEYWLNKDANEVEITFTNSVTENVVRELVETAYEGVNYTTWGGINASSLVVEPNFYDVNIVAESKYDSFDIDTWSSPAGDITSPTYSNVAADSQSVENFNPYANLQIRVDFDLGDWATVDFGVCEPDITIICLLIEKDRLLSPGHHTLYWEGRDDNGQIYEGDFLVYQNFLSEQYAFGVKTGAIVVYYDYPTFEVKDLLCNSYRIIPLYNEVSTISYELTRDSNVTIDIVDPDGSHFRTLVDDVFYTADTYEVVWDGKDDSGKYISTEGEYAVTITAAYPNHPEVKTIRTGSITVYR